MYCMLGSCEMRTELLRPTGVTTYSTWMARIAIVVTCVRRWPVWNECVLCCVCTQLVTRSASLVRRNCRRIAAATRCCVNSSVVAAASTTSSLNCVVGVRCGFALPYSVCSWRLSPTRRLAQLVHWCKGFAIRYRSLLLSTAGAEWVCGLRFFLLDQLLDNTTARFRVVYSANIL